MDSLVSVPEWVCEQSSEVLGRALLTTECKEIRDLNVELQVNLEIWRNTVRVELWPYTRGMALIHAIQNK